MEVTSSLQNIAEFPLPRNVLWFSSIALNAIAFSAKAGASRREAVAMSFAFIFALVPPVATANAIFMLVFPRYVSSDCSFLHKGFVVGVVVPSSFFFSQFCSRQACLVIMGPNRHPGRVARLLCFSMILESFARRVLLCGVQDLRLIILSSLVLGGQWRKIHGNKIGTTRAGLPIVKSSFE